MAHQSVLRWRECSTLLNGVKRFRKISAKNVCWNLGNRYMSRVVGVRLKRADNDSGHK